MYSPKISENLIPELYKLARERKRPMTKVVNEILNDYLRRDNEAKKKAQAYHGQGLA